MGGKGSGRHKETKTSAEVKMSMSKLDPVAIKVIEETLDGDIKDRLRYEAAINVYEHNHGKAKIITEETGVGLSKLLFMAVLEAGAEARSKYIDINPGDVIQLGEGGENAIQDQRDEVPTPKREEKR